MTAPNPLEGLRPKHLQCPSCGYAPSGMPITDGAVTCPECGAMVRFELVKPAISRRVRWASRASWVFVVLVLAAIGIIAWSAGGARVAMAYATVLTLVVVLAKGVHTLLTRH